MTGNYTFTRNLARKGTPNLYLAAHFLEPDDKFHAFLSTYAAMRIADDIVDHSKQKGRVTTSRRKELISELNRFQRMFEAGQIDDSLPYAKEMKMALARFQIPTWPFVRLTRSMKFDVDNDRFESFRQFLRYSEGAAVAPASIFMHLSGCNYTDDGQMTLPSFDIRRAARPMALFSYLVHIMRDFKKDYSGGTHPLVYFDLSTTDEFHVSERDMEEAVKTGTQSYRFTKMIQWYFSKMNAYRRRAKAMLDKLLEKLPADGRFALAFIYHLYDATAKKIAANSYNLVQNDLNLLPDDIRAAAEQAAAWTSFDKTAALKLLDRIFAAEGVAA